MIQARASTVITRVVGWILFSESPSLPETGVAEIEALSNGAIILIIESHR